MEQDYRAFFSKMPPAQALFETLAAKISARWPDTRLIIQRSQIAFAEKRSYAFVWLPIRPMRNRPDVYVIVSFGLDRRVDSPRIVQSVEPYPRRWTHHVIIQNQQEIDDELIGWLGEARCFAGMKRTTRQKRPD